jgi:hypothetical protein
MDSPSRLCPSPESVSTPRPRSDNGDDDRAIGDGSNMVFIRYPDDASKRLTYAGEVDWQGCRHGLGLVTWADGSRYAGEWYADRPSGHGVQTYADGSLYEGQFLDEQRQGAGAFTRVGGDMQICGHWTAGEVEETRRFLMPRPHAGAAKIWPPVIGDGGTPALQKQVAEAIACARKQAQRATDAAWALSVSFRLGALSCMESPGGSEGPLDDATAGPDNAEVLQQPANDHADAPDSPLVTFPIAQASEEQAAPDATEDAVSASPDVTEEAIPVSSAEATAAKEDFWSGLSTAMVQKRDFFLAPARLPPMLNATHHYAAQSARLRSQSVSQRQATVRASKAAPLTKNGTRTGGQVARNRTRSLE